MTKHVPEGVLKCHLTVEDPKKLVEENALKVYDLQNSSELKSNNVVKITAGIKPDTEGLQKMVVPELYNLEDDPKSEKTVKINLDLDLYQMERG